MQKIKYIVLVILCGVVLSACSGKYIDGLDENITQAEQEKKKIEEFYNEVARPQVVSTIERTESTYRFYLGSNLEATESDTGVQDFIYKTVYKRADEGFKKKIASIDSKVVKFYKDFQETKERLADLDEKIRTKFDDFDEFVKEARSIVDQAEEANEKANLVKEEIQNQLNSL